MQHANTQSDTQDKQKSNTLAISECKIWPSHVFLVVLCINIGHQWMKIRSKVQVGSPTPMVIQMSLHQHRARDGACQWLTHRPVWKCRLEKPDQCAVKKWNISAASSNSQKASTTQSSWALFGFWPCSTKLHNLTNSKLSLLERLNNSRCQSQTHRGRCTSYCSYYYRWWAIVAGSKMDKVLCPSLIDAILVAITGTMNWDCTCLIAATMNVFPGCTQMWVCGEQM